MTTPRPYDDERGSVTMELAIWALPLILLISLLIAGGRVALTGNAVQSAAFAAAREATLTYNSIQAQNAGEAGADFSLDNNGVTCLNRRVILDTSAFNQPPGAIGSVTANLTCTVNLANVGLPGIPGSVDITRTSSSPVDPYRDG
jgi:Flp pilus assembly protein TadG